MFMKKIASTLAATAVCCCLGAGTAWAQSASATVTFEVQEVFLLNLNGSASLTINTANIGTGLIDAVDLTGMSYDITSNCAADNPKIVGRISAAMPANTSLSVNVAAPSGAVSEGWVVLSDSDQDLVTGIGNLNQLGLAIGFKLSASVAAGEVPSDSRTFTMTIVSTT
jgi:hypothetical protein